MVTIRDVAKLARVSTGTVYAAAKGKTSVRPQLAERVWKAIEPLDNHPDSLARSLQVRRTNIVGVVLPQMVSPLFDEVLEAIEEEANQKGYSVLICDSGADPALE